MNNNCFNKEDKTVATNKTVNVDLEKLKLLLETQPSVLNNYASIGEWKPYMGNCPSCGSSNLEYQSGIVLTSNPPQYNCRCKDCGKAFYSGEIKIEPVHIPTLPKEPPTVVPGYISPEIDKPNYGYGNYGWICPKCGRALAPHVNSCPHCSEPTTINITY